MAESAIISWTPANWITILLMVFLGYAIIGFLAKMWQERSNASLPKAA